MKVMLATEVTMVADVPLVMVMVHVPAPLTMLAIDSAEPAVAPYQVTSTTVVDPVMEVSLITKACVAPDAIDTLENVT